MGRDPAAAAGARPVARPGWAAGGVLTRGDTGRDPLPRRQRHQVAGDARHLMPWDRVYAFIRRWRDHSLVKEFHDRLRARIREREGRDTEPTAGVIDSLSVKADTAVGSDSHGFNGGKLINRGLRRADVGGDGTTAGGVRLMDRSPVGAERDNRPVVEHCDGSWVPLRDSLILKRCKISSQGLWIVG